jgi:hypothetical protein
MWRPIVIESSHDITPFEGETPRREAMRTMGVAGAALFSVVGLGAAAQAKGKNRTAGAKKKRKRRNKKCKCPLIGLTSAESEPFSLAADSGATMKAVCPEGFIALSGGLQGESEVTAQCMIRESHTEPDGSAWVVNVFCTEATNVDLVVGAICFSLRSFQPQGQSSVQTWWRPD